MVKKKTAKKVPRASKKIARADAKPRTPAKRAAAKVEKTPKSAKKTSTSNGAARPSVDEMRGVHQVENLRAELKTKPKSVGRDAALKVVSWILGDTTFGLSELASVVSARDADAGPRSTHDDVHTLVPPALDASIHEDDEETVDPFS